MISPVLTCLSCCWSIPAKLVILNHSSGEAAELPCNPNGGSPFLPIAFSRISGSLFTGWELDTCTHFCLAPAEQMAYKCPLPRRVERPSAKTSTKGIFTAASLLSLLSLPSKNDLGRFGGLRHG